MKKVLCILSLILLIIILVQIGGCKSDMKENNSENSNLMKRDINTVKEEHTDELMAISGVVGLFVGETEEKIPCIRVMVVKKTAELEKKIPSKIEGHPVIIDETGEIKPLK